MKASNRLVARNTFFLYIMTGAKFILPLIITACLTRRLGPDAYGVISYLTPVMGYFILLFDFGFNFSATKKIAQNRGDREFIEKTVSAVYTAKIILVLAGLILLVPMILLVDLLRQNPTLTILYYAATAVQIFVPDFLYRGLEKMEGVTVRYITAKIVTAVLILIIVSDDDRIIMVPVAYLLGTAVSAFQTNRHMVRRMGYGFSLSGVREAVAELKESTVYFMSTFAGTALSITSTFVMGIVGMPTVEIAYWGVAFQVVQAVQSMYDPIATSIYPHVAKKKDHKIVLQVTVYLLPAVAAGCAVLYRLAGLAVNVIAGEEYLAAVPVLQHLTPMLLFSFVAQMLGFPLLGAMGKERETTLTTVVAAAVQIAGLAALAVCNVFSLDNLTILRNVTEFILMVLRILFSCSLVRQIRFNETVKEK